MYDLYVSFLIPLDSPNSFEINFLTELNISLDDIIFTLKNIDYTILEIHIKKSN